MAFIGTYTHLPLGPTGPLTSTSASIAWNAALVQFATHTMTEDTTLANPTNLVVGQTYCLVVTQHASAPKTMAFGSMYKATGGIATVILTATNGAKDMLTFVYDGTHMITSFTPNIS